MITRTTDALGHGFWFYLKTQLGSTVSHGSVIPSTLAVDYLRTYLTDLKPRVGGEWPAIGRQFDLLGLPDESPNIITATDLVAVSFLSVNVPPRAAASILTTRALAISNVLRRIPHNLAMEDPGCTLEMYGHDYPMQKLWDLLRRDESGLLWKMGATTVSKIMARKRPELVPIQDSVVVRELGAADATFWDLWWQAMHLQIEGNQVVKNFAVELRASVPQAENLSLLRTLDIVIWMHGKYRPRTI